MVKGIAILALIGALFAYLIFDFVGNEDTENSFLYQNNKKDWAKYYTTDIMGDPVLDLSGVQFNEAKAIWDASDLKQEMMDNFPNFELIKRYVKSRLKPSAFRKYLLNKIKEIENQYISGNIDYDEAKFRLENI